MSGVVKVYCTLSIIFTNVSDEQVILTFSDVTVFRDSVPNFMPLFMSIIKVYD